MYKTVSLVVIVILLFFAHAFAYDTPPCWETVVPQNVTGFDFEIVSVVQGPDKSGLYTYTYTVYRMDNGPTARYRELSHFSFWFPCGLPAQMAVVNGIYGITMSCTDAGLCPKAETGGTNGMTEPVMNKSCNKFWGFKIEECVDNDDRMFLLPNYNGVSYPTDIYDPFCTIVFKSAVGPEWGKWLIKGGDGKSGLYDAGIIKVPTCFHPVDAGNMSWGQIKVMYR